MMSGIFNSLDNSALFIPVVVFHEMPRFRATLIRSVNDGREGAPLKISFLYFFFLGFTGVFTFKLPDSLE